MRVQDSKPIGVTTMGRKKQRLRKSERQNSESSDETTAADVQCGHLNKSVNLNVVRKALRIPNVVGKCQSCSANNDSTQKRSTKNDAGSLCSTDSPASAADESPIDCEPHSICICLQCGHQGCDRYSAEKHALQHFQSTTHSVAHNLVLNLSSFQAWCYACDNHVPVDGSKKVLECVEFIYRLSGHKDSVASYAKRNDALKDNGPGSNDASALELRDGATGSTKDDRNRQKVTYLTPATSGALLGYPKVKGLNNLGNTCFFNAVVQNLGQTHLLELQLREFSRKGHLIDLFACPLELEARSCTDDEMEEKDEVDEEEQETRKPECLSLSLGDSGQLTQSMLSLFDEMKSSTGKQNAVSPSALFGQVCKKAPRFKGFQQQDSHELLRYLLDAIRAEEIKRSQTAILRAFKLPENPKAKDVSDELKPKVKAYGRQAKHTFVDSIFGGHLISTVICQACHTPFQVFEPFLDLSLPLSEEKPSKSASFHGGGGVKTKEEGKKGEVGVDQSETNQSGAKQERPSKYLTKKEKRLAKKKGSKGKKKTPAISSEEKVREAGDVEGTILEPNHTAATEGGDAKDVEDIEKVADDGVLQKDGGEDEEEEDNEEEGPENSMEEEEEEEVKGEAKEKGLNNGKLNEEVKSEGEEVVCGEVNEKRSAVENKDLQENSSLGSEESSDADVEDNIESDASRYQGMVNSIEALPDPSPALADGAPTPIKEQQPGSCVDQLEKEQSFECDDDDGHGGMRKGKDAIQCNGVRERVVDQLEKDLCCLRLSDESNQREPHATKQKLEKSAARFEVRRKAGIAATKTLIPRERPTQDWSILSVLYQFTSPELLSGNNMYICTVCNKRNKNTKTAAGSKIPVMTIASKQLLVFSPPAVLTLHLKRFQQVGFGLRKITRHVEFSELLDLAPYCSALCENVRIGQRRVLYSLFGIVEHSGTLRSGHYTSYVKVRHSNPNAKQYLQTLSVSQLSIDHLVRAMKAFATTTTCAEDISSDCAAAGADGNVKEGIVPPGKWFYISDSTVSEVRNISNVYTCQAYLLFYERIE